MKKFKKPPCAKWNMWLGPEIEGTANIGERTLFVRIELITHQQISKVCKKHGVSRIWFCYEFMLNSTPRACNRMFKALLKQGYSLAFEVPVDFAPDWAYLSRYGARYFKLEVDIQRGDHVCVGPAFADEAFALGVNSGAKVSPKEYLKDEEVCLHTGEKI